MSTPLKECCRRSVTEAFFEVAKRLREKAIEKETLYEELGLGGIPQVRALKNVADDLERAARANGKIGESP